MSFQHELEETIKYIRRELQQVENVPDFSFEVKASGRVHDGDIKVQFIISNTELFEEGVEVKGNAPQAVLSEFLRRFKWKKTHAPLSLSYERSDA